MKYIELYKPTVEDLWFRQQCMADPKTMNYNAGYDVHYSGYHYDSGCIDFPKEKWQSWADDRLADPNLFFAYILDKNSDMFVGYVNYKIEPETKKATMGIVVKNEFQGQGYMRPAVELLMQTAKSNGVVALVDSVPQTRERALKVFFDLGFVKVREFVSKKFGEDELVFEIEKTL